MAVVVAIRQYLPEGGTLSDENWASRHTGVLWLLAAHAVGIPVYAVLQGFDVTHVLLEAIPVPAFGLLAAASSVSRRIRTLAAALALLSSSAILVHLSGGLIEMHFHFFVMVAVVSLYQDWIPFLAAIGYVLAHHGVVGAIDPTLVFNHSAAIEHPWRWAAIHAMFIAGISVACLVNWRLTETYLGHRRQAEERLRAETLVVQRLNEVGRLLGAELDLDHLVQTVTDVATELTSAEFGAFFYNVNDGAGGSYLLYTLSGAPLEVFADFDMPRNTAVFAPTFGGDGPVRLDDVTTDPRYGHNEPYFGMPPGHLPVRSYLAVAVMSRGEVVGGLFLGHPEPGQFTDDDERIAVGVAAHAGVAVHNARLYASQREAAETLQHSMLPAELPTIAGLSMAARYVAGGPGVDVGGDWYDAFSLPSGEVALVMGDVVGRGLDAAALMSQLRNALRAYAMNGESPAETVRRLNALIGELGPSTQMATLAYAVLDHERGAVRFTNAGHPPPALIGPDGSVRFVEGDVDVPLGALTHTQYREQTLTLEPGSTMVLYTDGLVEHRERSLDDGLALLREVLSEAPFELEELCDRVLQRCTEGTRADDDTALLAVRCLSLADHVEVTLPAHPNSLRDVRTLLRRWLRHVGMADDEAFDVVVAVGEACSNAVRHAPVPGAGRFTLELRRNGDVEVVVKNDGGWRPGSSHEHGGRGLAIMRELMDEVVVTQGPPSTIVAMRRALSRDLQPSP